ncbi:transposase [Ktedonobacter robiniae]|uniref:Tc1-like transposase DDE domain-containing protein n=1 Tax=Ktedonobacter robiniae TaxID=2778365 RepID=A0ABQ3V533_9CHLR|nr:transposase [Ktedonobacter robiniae]GHO60033.1 hypothetical protein KSB_85080 [Ktedonobacter robiniae]
MDLRRATGKQELALIIEGSATTTVFEEYVERILAPGLAAGQLVIMDNLAAHKSTKVQELIAARGSQVLFSPSYSRNISDSGLEHLDA